MSSWQVNFIITIVILLSDFGEFVKSGVACSFDKWLYKVIFNENLTLATNYLLGSTAALLCFNSVT